MEAALHHAEDLVEIATYVMKAACELYEAEWCGILTVDMHTGIWKPEIWYDIEKGPMKETRFRDYERNEDYKTWVGHLDKQTPVIIPDVEVTRLDNETEYEAYTRLGVHSVIGVPFGQHPLGFMVVKNPKQNMDKPHPLHIACFVAMMMLEHVRRLQADELTIFDSDPKDNRQLIRLDVLGPHSLKINGGSYTEKTSRNINRRAWLVLLYLKFHRPEIDQTTLIRDNWMDEDEEKCRNNVRQAITRMHSVLAVYHDIKVVDMRNGMLSLTKDVNIVTDAEDMENLYHAARECRDEEKKLFLLEKAFSLYNGRLFQQGEDEPTPPWLDQYKAHYSQIYIEITNDLLELLSRKLDYHKMLEYGPKSLHFEPGNHIAYYWVLYAAVHAGNRTTIEMYYDRAKENLIPDELQEVVSKARKNGLNLDFLEE